jgi:hypothetical protein
VRTRRANADLEQVENRKEQGWRSCSELGSVEYQHTELRWDRNRS